jgi:RNA polymerase-binding protein DksA
MARKNTFLSDAEIDDFRRSLLQKRKALQDEIDHLQSELSDENREESTGGGLSELPTHPADQGTDMYDRELTMSMIERQQAERAEVDAALQRIEDGTFGICEGTGEPIEKRRLKARPWSRYSLAYAEKVHG